MANPSTTVERARLSPMRDISPRPNSQAEIRRPQAPGKTARSTSGPRISDVSAPGTRPEMVVQRKPDTEAVGSGAYETKGKLAYQRTVVESQARDAMEKQHIRSLAQTRAMSSSASAVPAPSSGRYMIGKILALILDFVDILTTLGAVTGIGWLVGIVLDSSFGLLLHKWISQGYATKGAQAQADIGSKINSIDRRITSIRNTGAKLARTGRKIPRLRKPIRRASRGARGVTRKFKPLRRLLITVGLDSIPVIELLPLKFLLVRSMHKDHIATYAESQNQMKEFLTVQNEETQQFAEQQRQRAQSLIQAYEQSLSS